MSHFNFHNRHNLLQDQNQEYRMYELREQEAEKRRNEEIAKIEEKKRVKNNLILSNKEEHLPDITVKIDNRMIFRPSFYMEMNYKKKIEVK